MNKNEIQESNHSDYESFENNEELNEIQTSKRKICLLKRFQDCYAQMRYLLYSTTSSNSLY